jgi:hypothetical protein
MLRKSWWVALLITVVMSSVHAAPGRLGYDPEADPFEQYHAAIETAEAENKLVLVIAGGDWCYWCHVLNKFMVRNTDVKHSLEDAFVVVKVYVGDENYNELFFEQLPQAVGAPHFWIIAPDRNVLSSQSTSGFERGKKGYDKQQFLDFVQHWKLQSNLMRSAHADAP